MSAYAPTRPRWELLEVLSSIAAYQDRKWLLTGGRGPRWGMAGAWCIVRQSEILKWRERFLKRYGVPITAICRRTLNYHLAGLVRDRFLAREPRHITNVRGGRRRLDLRPSLYKFTTLGRLWIKRTQGWVANPLDHRAVQKVAQSGFNNEENSSTSLSSVVDKAPTTGRARKTAALRRRASSSARRASPGPSKAPSRGGAARAHRSR